MLAAILQGHLVPIAWVRRLPDLGGDRVLLDEPLNGHVGDAQRAAHVSGDRGQHHAAPGGHGQLFGDSAQGRVGIVAIAVEQSIDRALQEHSERVHEDRDDDRAGDGRRRRRRTAERRRNDADHAEIQNDHDQGQSRVDERPAQQRLEVEEPVAQQRDGKARDEDQPGHADGVGGQQRRPRDQLRDEEEREAQRGGGGRRAADPEELLALDRLESRAS